MDIFGGGLQRFTVPRFCSEVGGIHAKLLNGTGFGGTTGSGGFGNNGTGSGAWRRRMAPGTQPGGCSSVVPGGASPESTGSR